MKVLKHREIFFIITYMGVESIGHQLIQETEGP